MNSSLEICLLLGLNVFQTIFWSWQLQKLSNKLMCRSFNEYSAIVNPPELKPIETDLTAEIEETEILDQLNGMLKPVEHI